MRWIKYLFATLCLSIALFANAADPQKVNINTATAEQLANLNGIGKVKAEAIVAHRQQIGAFKSMEELTLVKGIGPSILEKNKDLITLE